MIKQEIIEKISKYFKLTNFEAEKIYDDIFAGIIKGVKEENIADVTNLGEFIIKYNSGDENDKKTVEFLPTLSLEEEINQRAFEENRQFEPEKITSPEAQEKISETPVVNPTTVNPVIFNPTENVQFSSSYDMKPEEKENLSVEDEIRRKREEILNKITTPKVEQKSIEKETFSAPVVPPVVIPPVNEAKTFKVNETSEIISEKTEEIKKTAEEISSKADILSTKAEELNNKTEELKSNLKDTEKEVEEVTEKSFSDYFTEVSNEEKKFSGEINKTNIPPVPPVIESNVIPPVETVIPPSAVELHNQITGDQGKTNEYQTTITPMPFANGNGNGNGKGNGNGDGYEHKLQDNSYYIWYKDSEPNTTDTQTMSYEYELLYQATKEAEYKSKLRIYVTTFIMFFSIVLILLIFSPVIYKYFFTPSEENTEEVQQETSQTEEPQNTAPNNNQASVNSLDNQQPTQQQPVEQQNTAPQNNTSQEQPKQEQPTQQQPVTQQPVQQNTQQEAPKQEQPKQETNGQPNSNPNVPGVTKSSMGWLDDYNKVIYIQLDNGKFTIQESAWDSDAKANKRISAVGGLIPGLKGNVVKVDLGSKGTWFRARFGEFASIEEARKKAEELRTKEKGRLQALLLSFLLYA